MCGRFTNTAGPDELTERIGRYVGVTVRDSASEDPWNVRPTEAVVSIIAPDEHAQAALLRWSFVPSWAQRPMRNGATTFNATLERLLDTGNYYGVRAEPRHRALVLADSFFEWEHPPDGGRGRPLRFTVDDGTPFAFAAVWTTNTRITGEPIRSCSIITCKPNEVVAPVHNRMPVIFADPEQLRAWLSPEVPAAHALELCTRFPAERMSVAPRAPGSDALGDGKQLTLPT